METYENTMRTGTYPFQQTHPSLEGIGAFPLRSVPSSLLTEAPNDMIPDTGSTKPTKQTKIRIKQPQPCSEGIAAFPLRSVPSVLTEAANDMSPDIEFTKPTKPTMISIKLPKLKPCRNSSKSKKAKESSSKAGKHKRKNLSCAGSESDTDASGFPAPVCSCTGIPQIFYRWGTGGWQSSCCTSYMSEYPLPFSLTKSSSRIAGRKMSGGAYDKLLQRLAGEGHDLTTPVDLKDRWAKHGTNSHVTFK